MERVCIPNIVWRRRVCLSISFSRAFLINVRFGDGKTFPRLPRVSVQLARLAAALANEDKID